MTESQWHPEPDELVALAVTDVDAVAQEKLLAHLPTARSVGTSTRNSRTACSTS